MYNDIASRALRFSAPAELDMYLCPGDGEGSDDRIADPHR